jgi:hypothetical protein
MGLDCFLNLIMVEIVNDKARSPLFGNLDQRAFLFFGNRAMVSIKVGDLLLSHKVWLRIHTSRIQ